MTTTVAPARIVVSDGRVNPDALRSVRLTSCLPLLAIGLTAPAAIVFLVDPYALARLAQILPGLLLPFLGLAIAIFTYSVLVPGDVTAIAADPETRTLTIVEANLFARRHTTLAFGEVADVHMANTYDHDGYATRRAEIALRDAEPVVLPAWVSEAEAAALRRALRGGQA